MNQNSTLSVRDDVAFGVYDVETDSPEVAVIQLTSHEFFHFEDDAARIMAKLFNGQSISEVLNWSHTKLAEIDADENAFAQVGAFLDEFLPKIFVSLGETEKLTPSESSFHSPDETNNIMGEPHFFDICNQKDRLALACCELTYSCQLRCQHCYNPHHQSNDILSTKEWIDFARQARKIGVLRVILTGGDPLCHPGFWEIVEEFHRLHIAIDIYTNGQVLSDPEQARRLASYHPRSIQCSLYATSAEIHDTITTISGSWEKTVQCLKNFAALNVPIVIKMPIMKPNFQEHTKMAAFAKDLGATLQVDLGIMQNLNGSDGPVQLRLDDESMYTVMQNKDLSLYQFTQRFTNLDSMRLSGDNAMCNAGHGVFDVNPTGTVLPCINFAVPLGELRKNSLQKITDGEQLKHVRGMIRKNRCEKCQKCEMESFCAFCPGLSLLEKGDYRADNSLSCQNTRVYRRAAQ